MVKNRFRFRFWAYNTVTKKEEKVFSDLMDIDGAGQPYDDSEGGAIRYFTDCVCEQCTGVKDKNGKLIYEGDILNYDNQHHTVVWVRNRLGFCTKTNDGKLHNSYEIFKQGIVVGNIHENTCAFITEWKD